MTRKIGIRPGTTFLGSPQRRYNGPWKIGGNPVSRAQFLAAYAAAFKPVEPLRLAIRTAAGVRGRKLAVAARRPLNGCEHNFEYHEDWEGDAGVVGGTRTIRWLECCHCGQQRDADYNDAPDYGDNYF